MLYSRLRRLAGEVEMITLFSFGYWGWGNATAQLVEAIDIAEKARGFKRPIFVDIRLLRQGRAKGFVGDAFRDLVGQSRYVWMQDLGNLKIATRGRGVKIKRPEAAADLLDLALRAANDRRRVIFFCACQFPRFEGKLSCHRDTVTDLLLAEAKKRGQSISVIEWPGGEPTDARLSVDRKLYSSVVNGRMYIPFDRKHLADFAGLPWGSILTLECDREEKKTLVAVGPANFTTSSGGYWRLPVCLPAEVGKRRAELLRDAERWRRECGLHERRVA